MCFAEGMILSRNSGELWTVHIACFSNAVIQCIKYIKGLNLAIDSVLMQ